MTNDNADPDSIEEAPEKKPRSAVVVVLSVLVGLLLVAGGAGAFIHFRQSKASQAELLAVKTELKKKMLAVEEMSAQLASLSSQMHALKGYSIARSGSSGEEESKTECACVSDEKNSATRPQADAKSKLTAGEPALATEKPAKHGVTSGGDAVAQPKSIPEAKYKAPAQEPVAAPAVVKPKSPPRQDCELVGKSPEEQAETLKRCVSLIDSPPRRAGSR